VGGVVLIGAIVAQLMQQRLSAIVPILAVRIRAMGHFIIVTVGFRWDQVSVERGVLIEIAIR
jgi:hypothetical protein